MQNKNAMNELADFIQREKNLTEEFVKNLKKAM